VRFCFQKWASFRKKMLEDAMTFSFLQGKNREKFGEKNSEEKCKKVSSQPGLGEPSVNLWAVATEMNTSEPRATRKKFAGMIHSGCAPWRTLTA